MPRVIGKRSGPFGPPWRRAWTVVVASQKGGPAGTPTAPLLLLPEPEKARPVGESKQLGAGADAGLLHHAASVGLDGSQADGEALGDLLVGVPRGQQGKHPLLPRRKRGGAPSKMPAG